MRGGGGITTVFSCTSAYSCSMGAAQRDNASAIPQQGAVLPMHVLATRPQFHPRAHALRPEGLRAWIQIDGLELSYAGYVGEDFFTDRRKERDHRLESVDPIQINEEDNIGPG